jgi:hypothetical protein
MSGVKIAAPNRDTDMHLATAVHKKECERKRKNRKIGGTKLPFDEPSHERGVMTKRVYA